MIRIFSILSSLSKLERTQDIRDHRTIERKVNWKSRRKIEKMARREVKLRR